MLKTFKRLAILASLVTLAHAADLDAGGQKPANASAGVTIQITGYKLPEGYPTQAAGTPYVYPENARLVKKYDCAKTLEGVTDQAILIGYLSDLSQVARYAVELGDRDQKFDLSNLTPDAIITKAIQVIEMLTKTAGKEAYANMVQLNIPSDGDRIGFQVTLGHLHRLAQVTGYNQHGGQGFVHNACSIHCEVLGNHLRHAIHWFAGFKRAQEIARKTAADAAAAKSRASSRSAGGSDWAKDRD